MVDFKSHRAEIKNVQTMLKDPNISYHRRRDLKRYLGRLHKELSEALKYPQSHIDEDAFNKLVVDIS